MTYERREPDQAPAQQRSGLSPTLITLGIVAIVAVIFIVQNSSRTDVNFLFFNVQIAGVGGTARRNRDRRPARPAAHRLVAPSPDALRRLTTPHAPRSLVRRCRRFRGPRDLAGSNGPDRPVVLVAHATGFHGHAYLPVAAALAPQYPHPRLRLPRSHGEPRLAPGWEVEWAGYGDDALAAAVTATAGDGDRPVIGFGHSMGGTGLLLAAHRRPELFGRLVLFGPIVPPIDTVDAPPDSHPVGDLVTATRRRRTLFPSIDAALANYASKPSGSFDPDALDAYVRYGFYPDVDGAGVRLKCDPELEARTFLAGTTRRRHGSCSARSPSRWWSRRRPGPGSAVPAPGPSPTSSPTGTFVELPRAIDPLRRVD